ncbi:MAG TPA: hypothetical protein VG057_13845, partial [Solirubrobacteraceae bacterium]|nr:hypothetical protein [Solirubrobacteraceae bacterium]
MRQDYLDMEKQAVLVGITPAGRPFLDSLLSITADPWHVSSVRGNLAKRKILVVVTARHELVTLPPEWGSARLPFFHWPLTSLSYLLQRHFPEERALVLDQMLTEHLERGLWKSSAEMCQAVSGRLKHGPAELEEALRQAAAGNLDLLRARSKPSESLLTRLDDERGIHATVIYIASYFPGISPQDFNTLVEILLGERTVQLEEAVQLRDERGETQTRRQKVIHKLIDLWRRNPDVFLKEGGLEAGPAPDGTHAVDFSPPDLRDELKTLLETRFPISLASAFARLQQVNLLFAPGVSATVVENLIHLSVERTLADPTYYGERWLLAFAASLSQRVGAEEVSGDPSEMLLAIVGQLHDEILRRHVYSRLAQLIREMLRHQRLLPTVRAFFETLFAWHRDDGALAILLELVKRLRFAPQFEPFHWLRRLLDEAAAEGAERTYLVLLELAAESGTRIFDLLDAIRGWLPEDAREPERYSPSNRYALRFIADYSHFSIS